ncbi:MAG: type III pantothenate kinase [Candidatus Omnitrophota bacterium]|nr:MAG: type III pantothenate kinase [Candidatus Omnitrophota bacterium]
MLLAIDIGNTNINFALFRNKKLAERFILSTEDYNFGRLRSRIKSNTINDVIICSVVPQVTERIKKDVSRLLGKKPYIIGKDIKVPIKNLYRKPRQVGQDRLVNAYAGVSLYGFPLIVIDYGTAVTFDVISGRKEYIGGMILPGLQISLETLVKKAALLPKIKLKKPRGLIGRDTVNSMLSGIVYGFAAMTDNLIVRIKKRIGSSAQVVATGGNIALIKKYCRQIQRIDFDLTLKGLNLIYRERLYNK